MRYEKLTIRNWNPDRIKPGVIIRNDRNKVHFLVVDSSDYYKCGVMVVGEGYKDRPTPEGFYYSELVDGFSLLIHSST